MVTKEFLVALIKQLKAPLAFTVLMFVVGIVLRNEIPISYQPVPYYEAKPIILRLQR